MGGARLPRTLAGRKRQRTANGNGVQKFTSRVQLTVGKDTFLVWRESANEDVCLAVACGCWVAEYCQRRLAIGF
jgi:hypothetical protein